MNRYIFGFIAAVGLIVLVIVLIVRSLVSGPTTTPSHIADITDYAGTANTVQFTIDTPVKAADHHYDLTINVSNYQSTLTVTQGYQGQVIRNQSYPMSTSSYAIFLRALKYNGFTLGNASSILKDERGQCALGSRYLYEVLDASQNSTQHFWYTSCGTGTFSGKVSAIRALFIAQIPDYSKLTSGLNVY